MNKNDKLLTPPIPQWYYLDVSNICNLRCPYCLTGSGSVPPENKGLMTKKTFLKILDKISPHAEFVALFNWGEPFMNKDICFMIKELSKRNIQTHIDSNLTLRKFSQEELEKIVLSGLNSLFASIDGVSQKAYEVYRKGGDVHRALDNLNALHKTKRRLGSQTPHLIWAYYVNKFNQNEIDEAKALASEMGIGIIFKQLSCPDSLQTDLIKTNPDLFQLPDNYESIYRTQKNAGMDEFILDARLPYVCRQPFTILTVNHNGDIFPCCNVTDNKFVIGNLLENSLRDIWEGNELTKCRSFLLDPETESDAVCRSCPVVANIECKNKPRTK